MMSGRVTYKIHAAELAASLWETDERGATWEYVYFLKDLAPLDIPYLELNQAVDYKPDAIPQRFNVLDGNKSRYFLQAFATEVAEAPFAAVQVELDANGALDHVTRALTRREQSLLRDVLLRGRPSAACGICGETFLAEFLVAAHIKPRSECTDDEKRDLRHIAMPMCLFGCDALYERGFLTIAQGSVRTNASGLELGSNIAVRLGELAGRVCAYSEAGRVPYFEWHRTHRFRS